MKTRWMFGTLLIGALVFSLVSCSDDTEPVDKGVPDQGIDGPIPDKKVTPPPDTSCTLTVAKINTTDASKVKEITAADDQDSSTNGIQIDVTVSASGLADKSTVSLTVTGLSKALEETTSSGEAVFKAVTIGSAVKTLSLEAKASGCTASKVIVTVKPEPECTFVAPLDGASLGKNDDKDSTNSTFDYDVKVATVNATGGTVALTVDSTSVGTQNVGAAGIATFTNSVLPEGTGKVLEATVTVGSVSRTCKATVAVNLKGLSCKVAFGKAPVDLTATLGKYGFGIAQSSSTTGFTTDVTVTTSSNSIGVILLIDGSSTNKTTTTTGTATFSGVAIADGDHTIEATCMETGTTNSGSSGKIKALVDTVAPPAVDLKGMTLGTDDLRLGKVCLNWTSVGDNAKGAGMGTYDIRYRTDKDITETTWTDASTTAAVSDLAAYPKGAYQEKCLTELPLGSTYYVAIRAKDKVQNMSAKVSPFKSVKVDFNSQVRAGITGAKAWGAITASGDFNCDGFADLAVGNPTEGTNNEGAVYIYLGSKSGYLNSPEKVITGTVAKGQFGAALVAMASFDKDTAGCRDLAVLASHNKGNKASVYVYFGRSKLFDRDDVSVGKGADVIYSLGNLGASNRISGIHSVGDMDFDLISDLAVTYEDAEPTKGKAEVWVIYGSKQTPITSTQKPVAKLLPAAAGLQITGGKPSEFFGSTVVGGRITHDLKADLLISATGKGTGAVYLVWGKARAATLPEKVDVAKSSRVNLISGTSSNGAFGAALAFVGDMDKDGLWEFAVSDPTTSSNTGTVYLFNIKKLPKTSADAVATVTHDITGATGDKFGTALGDMGHFSWKTGADLTGDGLADLVVSTTSTGANTEGTVYIIKGQKSLTGLVSSKAYHTFSKTGTTSIGSNLLVAPDINGKNSKGLGYPDLVIGDPMANSGAGQIFIYY